MYNFFKKIYIFFPQKVPLDTRNSFEDAAESFSPEVQKKIIFFSKKYHSSKNCSEHVEHSFDNPAENFSLEIRK